MHHTLMCFIVASIHVTVCECHTGLKSYLFILLTEQLKSYSSHSLGINRLQIVTASLAQHLSKQDSVCQAVKPVLYS